MKKILACALSAALLGGAMFAFSACNTESDLENGSWLPALEVYAPDGAPALALVNAIAKDGGKEKNSFDFNIVDANTITSYVAGANPKADIAVLPVNAAAKVLGTATTYQLLGTVTNGNLYFLTTGENPELNLTDGLLESNLVGKKIGVVQLTNVPGLTLQAVLNDRGIDYQIVQSTEASVESNKVNLIPFAAEDVTPAGGCDYYLCPEPAASAKIKGTASSGNPFKMAGDLQELYGGKDGYPQAAVVVKKSVIAERKADLVTFIGYLNDAKTYLETAEISQILGLLDGKREDGLSPSFSDKNLTPEVIARCSVKFSSGEPCKQKVEAFLEKLIVVNSESTVMPSEEFYYLG